MYFFHAVAIDYDGTLTERPRPDADVLAAIREVRETGRACVLVTGRILAELRADFPEVDRHFDAVVAENGAVLARAGGEGRRFVPGERALAHVRHWHKYVEGRLPTYRRFFFRDGRGPTGGAAANVPEFAEALEQAPPEVLRHHADHGDFSRWLGDLCYDAGLVQAVREVEEALARDGTPDAVESMRARLLREIGEHFATGAVAAGGEAPA